MERNVDKLLLLKLIKAAQGKGRLVTIPLHKLAFLSEYKMNARQLKGFSYSFFRDHFGPAAPGIYDDFGELLDAGLIRDCPFRLSSAGEELLQGMDGAFRRNGNRQIAGIVEEVARETPIETREIKDIVYRMSIRLPDGTVRKVSEIPYKPNHKILMMRKLSATESRCGFTLKDEEIETFEVMLDPDLRESLRRSEADARGGRISVRPAA